MKIIKYKIRGIEYAAGPYIDAEHVLRGLEKLRIQIQAHRFGGGGGVHDSLLMQPALGQFRLRARWVQAGG